MGPDVTSASPHQILRLRVGDMHFNGLVVSLTDEAMMVATTLREQPDFEPGVLVHGEMPKPDGLYLFATRLRALQLTPVLMLILERPSALRRVQRRDTPRYPTRLEGQLVFVSSALSLNTPAVVTNVSLGGFGALAPEPVPVGCHCIALVRQDAHELRAICRVAYAEERENHHRLGLRFVEMSHEDLVWLESLIASLEEGPGD